jgi:hypothetical protein
VEKRRPYLFGELVRVAAVGIDVTQRCWGASVVEEVHQRVDALRVAQVEAVNTITLDTQFRIFLLLFSTYNWLPFLPKAASTYSQN